jgi:hypothetical protein
MKPSAWANAGVSNVSNIENKIHRFMFHWTEGGKKCSLGPVILVVAAKQLKNLSRDSVGLGATFLDFATEPQSHRGAENWEFR